MIKEARIFSVAAPVMDKHYNQPGLYDSGAIEIDVYSERDEGMTDGEKTVWEAKCQGCTVSGCNKLFWNGSLRSFRARVQGEKRLTKEEWEKKMKASRCKPQVCF